MTTAITETNFTEIGMPKRGKVRDIYDFGRQLLIVTTDRISAFDVIMPEGVPSKGHVLNRISELWFKNLTDIIPNHLITCDPADYPEVCYKHAVELWGRSMLVKKTQPLKVECVVRGYITGSGWGSYQKSGTVCGIALPPGLVESDKLPEAIFTPTTKAESGHDLPITFEQMVNLIGYELAIQVRDASLRLYHQGSWLASQAGIIIADSKFEFGLLDGELILIDELLTPDSSRFWPADEYRPGGPQKSFDKQYLRDYLVSISWNQKPPAPHLPPEVIESTKEKYLEAMERLESVLI